MHREQDLQRYRALAADLGADDVVAFTPDDIVFEPRTILKCMYGCSDWGRGPTCPSRAGSLMPWEYEPLLRRYKWGVIVHSSDKKTAEDVKKKVEDAGAKVSVKPA